MVFSHRFGSMESLSRARYWMTRLGFEVTQPASESHDVSRLSLNVDFSKAAAAMALIDSIEAADPAGWPGYMTPSRTTLAPREANENVNPHQKAACSPIHWHQRDDVNAVEPHASKVVEYMLSRWE